MYVCMFNFIPYYPLSYIRLESKNVVSRPINYAEFYSFISVHLDTNHQLPDLKSTVYTTASPVYILCHLHHWGWWTEHQFAEFTIKKKKKSKFFFSLVALSISFFSAFYISTITAWDGLLFFTDSEKCHRGARYLKNNKNKKISWVPAIHLNI